MVLGWRLFWFSYSSREAVLYKFLKRRFEVSQEHGSAIFDALEIEKHMKSTKMKKDLH